MAALEVGQPAPDLIFEGEGDRALHLESVWREHPTIVVFLRHFG